jgi:hypothetical protein
MDIIISILEEKGYLNVARFLDSSKDSSTVITEITASGKRRARKIMASDSQC